MRKISIILIVIGLVVFGTSLFKVGDAKIRETKNLEQAQSIIENRNSTKEKEKSEEESTEQVEEATMYSPEHGDVVGVLQIPKLNSDLPIIEGTEEEELAEGVGHYAGTAYPLQNDQIVLSGHRDTVFRRMGELDIGDIMTVQLEYGDFDYEIVETKIVAADDLTIIVPTSPDEVLTVTTCYPFNFVGYAPDRYIITALPVEK